MLYLKRQRPKNKLDYDPEVFPTLESIANSKIADILKHVTAKYNGPKYITNKRYCKQMGKDLMNKVLLIEKGKFHMQKYNTVLVENKAKGVKFEKVKPLHNNIYG